MSQARPILLFTLALLAFMLFQAWQQDYGPRQAVTTPEPTELIDEGGAPALPSSDGAVPTLNRPSEANPPAAAADATGQRITVTTDVLEVVINTRGGQIERATLLNYPVERDTPEVKVSLLSAAPADRFVAQSGLISSSHSTPDHQQTFSASASEYQLGSADELVVPLSWRGDDGIEVSKNYRFVRGDYLIGLEQTINNQSDQTWRGAQYQQLLRRQPPEEKRSYNDPARFSFLGGALYSDAVKYEQLEFDDFTSAKYTEQQNAWVAMVQHYFLAAWVPPSDQGTVIEAEQLGGGVNSRFIVRTVSPAQQIEASDSATLTTALWLGPKLQERLGAVAEGLNLTVDYGIFTPLSKVLFWILNKIHSFVGNWGVAIILLTVLVKAVFYKLSEAQYRSAAKQRKLQPKIKALRERLGDDKQKLNMEIMQLFQKEKVNPLGGCLPLLVQLPVFFALYWVLLESVELRQAPFMLWLQDLNSPDPFFVLPLINGAAMWATMKLSPNPMADPIQQRIFTAMPIVMTVMFAFFQSGLVLYWATNAVLSLIQQWYITRKIDREDT